MSRLDDLGEILDGYEGRRALKSWEDFPKTKVFYPRSATNPVWDGVNFIGIDTSYAKPCLFAVYTHREIKYIPERFSSDVLVLHAEQAKKLFNFAEISTLENLAEEPDLPKTKIVYNSFDPIEHNTEYIAIQTKTVPPYVLATGQNNTRPISTEDLLVLSIEKAKKLFEFEKSGWMKDVSEVFNK